MASSPRDGWAALPYWYDAPHTLMVYITNSTLNQRCGLTSPLSPDTSGTGSGAEAGGALTDPSA